ncbi:hypothetical protein NQ318_010825 [Aromia moschata]|uniref:Peptidase M14 domain-containing protein n=1 Tax=Aromia moschata TaxID=1265417 RepID=A0AAV8YHE6_9CUCU|nr:hypothetical protein NQ318_010825 [Aromia moschata]
MRYKVYRVSPTTIEEANLVNSFENDENFDFWVDIRSLDEPAEIMVSPIAQEYFEETLRQNGVDYIVSVYNVAEIITQAESRAKQTRVARGNVTFSEFMRHDEIIAYLRQLEVDYPDILKTEVIGRSFEGRDLLLVRISSGGSTTNKPTIFAEATIHAREWIAPPMALYIINQLVENPENANMYQDIDWAIIPVLNPDGYEYTHTAERFWRKTRTPGTICYGVDGNRNFAAKWGETGSNNWQCSNTYAGHRVFSEPETQAVSSYIASHKDEIKLYIDIHSFGRWLLYPYGYTNEDADNVDELRALGQLFNDAVYEVRGLNYTVVSFVNGLYYASGTSVDWVKEIGIDLAYTLELPAGGTGFDPPEEDIQPVVQETWEGFKAFHSYIQSKFVN